MTTAVNQPHSVSTPSTAPAAEGAVVAPDLAVTLAPEGVRRLVPQRVHAGATELLAANPLYPGLTL